MAHGHVTDPDVDGEVIDEYVATPNGGEGTMIEQLETAVDQTGENAIVTVVDKINGSNGSSQRKNWRLELKRDASWTITDVRHFNEVNASGGGQAFNWVAQDDTGEGDPGWKPVNLIAAAFNKDPSGGFFDNEMTVGVDYTWTEFEDLSIQHKWDGGGDGTGTTNFLAHTALHLERDPDSGGL